MIKKDSTPLGFLIGSLLPLLLLVVIYLLIYMITKIFHLQAFVSLNSLILLSLAPNFVLVRYFFLTKKLELTSKGCLIITVAYIILFFIFIHGKQLYHLPGLMW